MLQVAEYVHPDAVHSAVAGFSLMSYPALQERTAVLPRAVPVVVASPWAKVRLPQSALW